MDRTIVLPYEPTNSPSPRELDRILAAGLSGVTLVYTYLYPAGYYWLGEIYLICTITTRTLCAHVTTYFTSSLEPVPVPSKSTNTITTISRHLASDVQVPFAPGHPETNTSTDLGCAKILLRYACISYRTSQPQAHIISVFPVQCTSTL
jgi:hypothetical protein